MMDAELISDGTKLLMSLIQEAVPVIMGAIQAKQEQRAADHAALVQRVDDAIAALNPARTDLINALASDDAAMDAMLAKKP